MTDITERLFDSSKALHERFDVYPPPLDAISRELVKEVYELTIEAERYENPYNNTLLMDVAKEAADVMVCVIGVCMAAGVSFTDLENAMRVVITKNDLKTVETHELNDKRVIVRRQP